MLRAIRGGPARAPARECTGATRRRRVLSCLPCTCTICSDDTEDERLSFGCNDARRPAAVGCRLPAVDDARQLAAAYISGTDTDAQLLTDPRFCADVRRFTELRWLSTAETRLLSPSAIKLCLELVEGMQATDDRSNTCAVHTI